MSILYLIIFLFVSYLFRKNFEKTLICYAPFKLIFHSGINLVDSFIAVPLDLAISFFAIFTYCRIPKKNYLDRVPDYLLVCWIIFCIGKIVYGSHSRFIPSIIFYEPVTSIAYGYILFKVIRTKSQVILLIKNFVYVAYILIADALIEFLFGINPIIEIEKSQAANHFWVSSNTIMRAGMFRATSFMGHSIAMGSIAVFLWGIFLLVYITDESFIYSKKSILICLGLLPVCMLFANSRTTIIMAAYFSLLILNKKFLFSNGVYVFIILLCICMFASDYLIWVYDSIFHENSVSVQGSSQDLRRRQWEVASYFFLKSPFLGQGADFNPLLYKDEEDVLGMESFWFQLLMYQGLVGLVSYCFLILGGFVCFWNTNKVFCLFSIAWIASITFSSQVGISTFLYMIAIIISYKLKFLNI